MKNRSSLEKLSFYIKEGDLTNGQNTLDKILKQRKGLNNEKSIEQQLTVYVAGPYTPYNADKHDAARIAHANTGAAIDFCVDVVDKGHLPYIPHLSHFMHLHGKKGLSYEYYTTADMVWLDKCDAILFYNHKLGDSKGADKELAFSIDNDKLIFFSVNEIPQYKRKE